MIKSIFNQWVYRAAAVLPVAAFVTLTSTDFVTIWGCGAAGTGGC